MITRIASVVLACAALGMSAFGCTANVDRPTVDQGGQNTVHAACVTDCDDTQTTCVAKCTDDGCKGTCKTTHDDCVTSCDES